MIAFKILLLRELMKASCAKSFTSFPNWYVNLVSLSIAKSAFGTIKMASKMSQSNVAALIQINHFDH